MPCTCATELANRPLLWSKAGVGGLPVASTETGKTDGKLKKERTNCSQFHSMSPSFMVLFGIHLETLENETSDSFSKSNHASDVLYCLRWLIHTTRDCFRETPWPLFSAEASAESML